MKLIAGHRYLKDAAGSEIVPYTEQMAKTLGVGTNPLCTWSEFIAAETVSNEMQLVENEKVVARKALPVQSKEPVVEPEPEPEVKKPVPVMKVSLAKPVAPVQAAKPVIKPVIKPVAPVIKQMQHMDIRSDMAADLAALE